MTKDDETTGVDPAEMAGLDLGELRARRDAAVDAETGLSYLRRLVQGPLDLVRAELEHRAAGEERDVAALVEGLPEVRTETGRGSSAGRIPRGLEPSEVDAELSAELQRLTAGGARVADLPSESTEALVVLAADLDVLERKISDRRKGFQRTIDALNGELAERYRSGSATVEGALAAPAD
jgi:hypothetical protein